MDFSQTLRSGLFWTGSASFVLMGAAVSLYGPALPAFARENGIGLAEAGLIVSFHNIGGLAALIAGALRGAASARLALSLLALGAAGIAAGAGWPLTLLAALVLGAGYAQVTVVFNRRFLIETGPRGPAMVGVLNAIFGIGAIAAPLIFVALGSAPSLAFGAVALAVAALIPFAGRSAAGASPAGGIGLSVRRPGILLLGAVGVGYEIVVVGLGPSALVARGLTEPRAAELASLFFACFLASRFSLLWLASRLAPLTLLALGFGGSGALIALAALLPPAVFYALAGAAIGLLFPAYFVAASVALGTDERATATIVAAAYVGAILLPAAASGAIALAGAEAVFPLAAAFGLAACLATLAFGRRA